MRKVLQLGEGGERKRKKGARLEVPPRAGGKKKALKNDTFEPREETTDRCKSVKVSREEIEIRGETRWRTPYPL